MDENAVPAGPNGDATRSIKSAGQRSLRRRLVLLLIAVRSRTSQSPSAGDARFATAFPQPQQGLIRFDAPAPPCRSRTELAPVPPAAVALDGVWASSAPASGAVAPLDDDAFLHELVAGGDQPLFSYGDFFAGLQPQDRALELSACYFPNMAEMWGAAAAADHAHAKPQGLCNTLM
ncbi:hypothetical protein EJB05_36554, partial [Eragrostis curvula]